MTRYGPLLVEWLRGELGKVAPGTSLVEWAQRHGLSGNELWRWEHGRAQPSFQKMVELSEELPEPYSLLDVLVGSGLVRPDQVGGHEALVQPEQPSLREAVDQSDLTQAQRAAIHAVLDAFERG